MRLEVISRQPTSNTKRCCYLYMAHGMARGHGMMVESSWQTTADHMLAWLAERKL